MTNRPYITCQALISFIAGYLDGALDRDTLYEFDRHLAVCPSCVAYLASYQETILILKAAANAPTLLLEEPPGDLVEAILTATTRGR